MRECNDCGKNATWKCLECEIYLCLKDRSIHLDLYLEHTVRRRKKATHKHNYQQLLSKSSLVDQVRQEIIDSSLLLADWVTKARQDALHRIEDQRNDLQAILSLLNEGISEEQHKETKYKFQGLEKTLLLQEIASSTKASLWFQQDILKETSKLYFKHTQDSENFQTNDCGVSIFNSSIPALHTNSSPYHTMSELDRRIALENEIEMQIKLEEERKRELPIAEEIYKKTCVLENELIELKKEIENKLTELTSILSNTLYESILSNQYNYLAPPNSLESELIIICKAAYESIDTLHSNNILLKNFINSTAIEGITEANAILNHTIIPEVQLIIRSCKSLLAFLSGFVIVGLKLHYDMKVSNDRKFYFYCKRYPDSKIYTDSKSY